MVDEGSSWNDLSLKVHKRRKSVQQLMRNNLSISELSAHQAVSEMTIRRDLAWLGESQLSFTKNLKPSQRIAETLALLKEIEEQSMVFCELAKNRVMIVDDLDGDGRLIKVRKVVPDGNAASKHLQDAMKARLSADGYIMKMGLLDERLDDPEVPDISKMGTVELNEYIEMASEKVSRLRADIERINQPSRIKELPKGWEKSLIGEKSS
jgi:hypothetical protein